MFRSIFHAARKDPSFYVFLVGTTVLVLSALRELIEAVAR